MVSAGDLDGEGYVIHEEPIGVGLQRATMSCASGGVVRVRHHSEVAQPLHDVRRDAASAHVGDIGRCAGNADDVMLEHLLAIRASRSEQNRPVMAAGSLCLSNASRGRCEREAVDHDQTAVTGRLDSPGAPVRRTS